MLGPPIARDPSPRREEDLGGSPVAPLGPRAQHRSARANFSAYGLPLEGGESVAEIEVQDDEISEGGVARPRRGGRVTECLPFVAATRGALQWPEALLHLVVPRHRKKCGEAH